MNKIDIQIALDKARKKLETEYSYDKLYSEFNDKLFNEPHADIRQVASMVSIKSIDIALDSIESVLMELSE